MHLYVLVITCFQLCDEACYMYRLGPASSCAGANQFVPIPLNNGVLWKSLSMSWFTSWKIQDLVLSTISLENMNATQDALSGM